MAVGGRPGHRPPASASTWWPGSASSLWGLIEMWTSASGGGRISAAGLVAALVAVVTAAAAAVFLVLPGPDRGVAGQPSWPRPELGGTVGVPGALAGDAGSPAQLSRAGSPDGPIRVGGYLGFASSLEHGPAGTAGQPAGDAGPGRAPVVLGGRDLRHLAGRELEPSRGSSHAAAAGAARPSSCPSPRATSRSASPTCRPSTSPAPPPTSSSMRRAPRRCGSPRRGSSPPTTAPSCRPSAWGADPSTRSSHVSTRHPRPAAADASPQTLPSGDPGGVRPAAPPVPPGPGAGPVRHGRRHESTYDQGGVAHRLDRRPHPLLHRHPAAAARRRTRSTSSSSATGSGSASRSRRRWR